MAASCAPGTQSGVISQVSAVRLAQDDVTVHLVSTASASCIARRYGASVRSVTLSHVDPKKIFEARAVNRNLERERALL